MCSEDLSNTLLSYKQYFKIKENMVWDVTRSIYVPLLPEEIVRQCIVQYLLRHQNIALSKLKSEYYIKWNNKSMRCDIVIFDQDYLPKVIIEVKAPNERINHTQAMSQISKYERATKAQLIWISNGHQQIYFHNKEQIDCHRFWEMIRL